MPTRSSIWLLLLTSTVALGAAGVVVDLRDSWRSYSDNRIVSPTGKYYAVLRSKKGFTRGPFSLHQRRAGVRPIEPAKYRKMYGASAARKRKEAAKIGPDPKDTVLFERRLPRLPMAAMVSDSPVGIVLFDTYAGVGLGAILSFIDTTGKEKWSVDLEALFGPRPKGSYGTASSLWWSSAWGMDAERRTAWVLTKGHEFREVSLVDGKISTPSPAVTARWSKQGKEKARIAVLDAIVRTEAGVAPECIHELAPLAANVKEPMALRLRAAVACLRAGSKLDSKALFVQAVGDPSPEVSLYGAAHLPEFAGEEAAPVLRDFLLRYQPRINPRPSKRVYRRNYNAESLVEGFRALGPQGLTMLRALLHKDDAPGLARLNAAAMLSLLGHKEVTSGLLDLCRDKKIGEHALDLLIGNEPPDLPERLIELATTGSGADGKIVLYFKARPERAAIPALIAIQNRSLTLNETERRNLKAALQGCHWVEAEKSKK